MRPENGKALSAGVEDRVIGGMVSPDARQGAVQGITARAGPDGPPGPLPVQGGIVQGRAYAAVI